MKPAESAERDSADADDGAADHVSSGGKATRKSIGVRAKIAVGMVCLLIGAGLAVQSRLAADDDENLRGARQEDLVRILDELDGRQAQLDTEIDALNDTKDQLNSGGDQAAAAGQQAQARADQLAILAGTVGAQGPGVIIDITDPGQDIAPSILVEVIQELRAAGAEAIQVGSVRIGVDSAVTGEAGAVVIDDAPLEFPLQVLAIGDPQTLSSAMGIPGGVIASVNFVGGEAVVITADLVKITALRAVTTPDYAEPAEPTE